MVEGRKGEHVKLLGYSKFLMVKGLGC